MLSNTYNMQTFSHFAEAKETSNRVEAMAELVRALQGIFTRFDVTTVLRRRAENTLPAGMVVCRVGRVFETHRDGRRAASAPAVVGLEDSTHPTPPEPSSG